MPCILSQWIVETLSFLACTAVGSAPCPPPFQPPGTGNWGRGHEPNQPVKSLHAALAACMHTRVGGRDQGHGVSHCGAGKTRAAMRTGKARSQRTKFHIHCEILTSVMDMFWGNIPPVSTLHIAVEHARQMFHWHSTLYIPMPFKIMACGVAWNSI